MQEKKRFLASTLPAYIPAMLRRLALSYWTPVLAGLTLLGLHLVWAIQWEPTKRGEAVTGFGACLIVLGLLVAARPYIRSGLRPHVDKAAGEPPRTMPWMRKVQWEIPQAAEALVVQVRYARKRRAATLDTWDERVIAVVVIAIGTLLNGYGTPLVRWFGWEG